MFNSGMTIVELRAEKDGESWPLYTNEKANRWAVIKYVLLHFVAFFHVASLFSAGVDNKKMGVDNEKALELTNSTVFHRCRQ